MFSLYYTQNFLRVTFENDPADQRKRGATSEGQRTWLAILHNGYSWDILSSREILGCL